MTSRGEQFSLRISISDCRIIFKISIKHQHKMNRRYPGTLLQYHYLMSHFAYRFWVVKT